MPQDIFRCAAGEVPQTFSSIDYLKKSNNKKIPPPEQTWHANRIETAVEFSLSLPLAAVFKWVTAAAYLLLSLRPITNLIVHLSVLSSLPLFLFRSFCFSLSCKICRHCPHPLLPLCYQKIKYVQEVKPTTTLSPGFLSYDAFSMHFISMLSIVWTGTLLYYLVAAAGKNINSAVLKEVL